MEVFLRSIQFIVTLVYKIVYALLPLIIKRKKPAIPPITNRILTLSVVELVDRLRYRQINSKELVKAYIDRIKEVDPFINAVIENRFEEAMEKAEKADEMIENNPLYNSQMLYAKYPILGIPFTVKESCGVKGMSHVVGSRHRVGKKSEYDCVAVENLCLAGGIPLLVSANPEYCFSIETNSFTNGRCLNPYDSTRTCGGSSGGEGALNGSGASLFGVGSDIAGSIRIPGLFNGVFGHKPTGGLIPNRGHFPNSDDPKCLEYLQMGLITRFASDLNKLLLVMAGENSCKLDLLAPVDTQTIKIFYSLGFNGLNGFLHQNVSESIKTSIIYAAGYFRRLGLSVEEVTIKNFNNSTEIAMTGIGRLRNFPYAMEPGDTPPTVMENLKELFQSFLGNSNYTKEALIFDLMRSTNVFMGAENMAKYEEETESLKKEFIELLGSDGVFFFPTFHVPAIYNNTSLLPLWGIDYSLIFNVLGLPCTHIPMGLDENDLPIGFQVVAAPMRDKLCIHIAEKLEEAFGGWTPPRQIPFYDFNSKSININMRK